MRRLVYKTYFFHTFQLTLVFLSGRFESVVNTGQSVLEIFTILGIHNFQDHTGEHGKESRHEYKSACDKGRKSGDQSGSGVISDDGNHEDQANQHKKSCDKSEEFHGSVISVKRHHLADYLESVGKGIQLAFASLRSVSVFNNHIVHLKVIVNRVDGHLGLNLKSLGKYGESLNKII